MSLLFIALDTLIRGVVVVGIFFGGRYLYREARQGFPSLNDPNHRYAESIVHAYNTVGSWELYYDSPPSIMFFHEECAKQYLEKQVETDIYYEVWMKEQDAPRSCQYCE